MKKNYLLWLSGLLLSGFLIISCGQSSDPKSTPPGSSPGDDNGNGQQRPLPDGTQEVFVSFPGDLQASGDSGKQVYVQYTTDGESIPTKITGETAQAEYVREEEGDFIWKAIISNDDNVRFVFYISNGTLAEANGRLSPDGFHESWREGESRTQVVEPYFLIGECVDDAINVCFAEARSFGLASELVYAGILFDTFDRTPFLVYTDDSSQPSLENGIRVQGEFEDNEFPYRIWEFAVPLIGNVNFVFYVSNGIDDTSSPYVRIGPGGQTDTDAMGYVDGDSSFSSSARDCTDTLSTGGRFCGGGSYRDKLPTQTRVCPTGVDNCIATEISPDRSNKRINLGIDGDVGRAMRIFVYYTTETSSTTVSRDIGENNGFVEAVFQEVGDGSGVHQVTRQGIEFNVIRADIPTNTDKFVVYMGPTTAANTANARLAKDGYHESFIEGESTNATASDAYFEGTDCAAPTNLADTLMDALCRVERFPTTPPPMAITATYDSGATPATAAADVPAGKRRVHAPFPFDTTGFQPFVVYVTANTWTAGSCSDTSITDEANCTGSNTWTAASCSDSSLTTQEACEPLPTRDTASAKWAPMTFGNASDPHSIWVADIPQADNIRFAFLIGPGGGTNEATHRPNLEGAFGRLANDAYREFTGSDVISGEGESAFIPGFEGPVLELETYFSKALSGRPDCSSNQPTNANFCLPLKVRPLGSDNMPDTTMKYVYLGFLFDTTGDTITIRYTTDGSEPSKNMGTEVTLDDTNWYGGIDLPGLAQNWVWRASLPDNAQLKYTAYIDRNGTDTDGRLSRSGYQEDGSYTNDGAVGVAFDSTDCQTTMQATRIAQEYRLCNANNERGPLFPVMASYDADAKPATADATVASGKRRVHAPFPFDTTGDQPFVVYVAVNTWTPGSCSAGTSDNQAACEAVPGQTWTAASCSDMTITEQAECEEPLPKRDTSSAKWAPMTSGNTNDPYSIWVADIPTGDSIRFAFFIGQGGGTNEATHKPNLARAFGRLANDAYREFTGSDDISDEGASAFTGWTPGLGMALETYFSGALSGRPDCSSNLPENANFCLPLKDSAPDGTAADMSAIAMKYVYLSFLFDTSPHTITVRYTTDTTTSPTYLDAATEFYDGLRIAGSSIGGWNRIWRASLPDDANLKYTVYIGDTGSATTFGRLSRKGYQEGMSFSGDDADGASGVSFDNTDCQTTIQAGRVAQEYRICNASNVRP